MDAVRTKLAFILPVGSATLQAWDILNTRLLREKLHMPYDHNDPLFGGSILADFIADVELMGYTITNKEFSRGEPVIRIVP